MDTSLILRVVIGAACLGGALAACEEDVLENGGVGGGPSGSTSIATGVGGATSSVTSSSGGPLSCPNPNYTDLDEDECQLLDRSSCPEPGTGCVAQGDGTTTCAFAGGLKEVQEPCQQNAECKAGLFCAFGRCAQPCCRETGDPCGSGECNVEFSVGQGNFIYYCSYLDTCTPFGEPCPTDQGCIPRFNEGDAICVGINPDAAAEAEGCDFINSCQLGLVCDTEPLQDVCRYLCKTNGSSTTPGEGGCPANQTCEAEGIAANGLGVCRPS